MKVLTIIVGILLVVVGFFCLMTPGLTLLSIGWLLGLMLLLAGISIIADYIALRRTGLASGWSLVLGIVTLVMGGLLLLNQNVRFATEIAMIYMLGIWMLVSGVIRIVEAVQLRRTPGSGWGWILVLGLIMAGVGIYSFFHPVVSALNLAWLIGFYIILAGVDLITFGFSMHKYKDIEGENHWTIAGE